MTILCYAIYNDTEFAKFALLVSARDLFDPSVLRRGLQKAWVHWLKFVFSLKYT